MVFISVCFPFYFVVFFSCDAFGVRLICYQGYCENQPAEKFQSLRNSLRETKKMPTEIVSLLSVNRIYFVIQHAYKYTLISLLAISVSVAHISPMTRWQWRRFVYTACMCFYFVFAIAYG